MALAASDLRPRSDFGQQMPSTIKSFGIEPKRIGCPWRNGIAERFVGSCRQDLLDHLVVLNKRYLKRLMAEYIPYYHDDRTHLGVAKQTPTGRAALRSDHVGKIVSVPRFGGLHHRYDLAAWTPLIGSVQSSVEKQ